MKTIIIKTQAELDALQRLLSKTNKNTSLGCWDFIGAKSKNGYGKLKFNNEVLAHRVSYLIFNGKILKNKDIAHDCDNRSCVNPSHLRTQTRLENMNGAVLRGRIKRGTENKLSKLTAGQISEIIRLRKSGWSLTQLANKFSVCAETIRKHTNKHQSDNFRKFLEA